ncbi:MAG: 2-oxo acid dehydrogenase subunit E2 [Tepidanaerobacteraceae bacterium]|jgi:pyruvate dehydrogenase E2 component (dihydrolipoamide acetyltransferase)|nr:2-oxo acid dehydrogenase subunit E2 [Tepidanaerobacteraceae bacterium]
MATILTMPKLGTTMEEGTIIKWLKKEGEPVEKGEAYVEIQTDKVNLEDEAPESGIMRKILIPEGAVVPVGKEIAIIAGADEPLPEIEKEKQKETETSPIQNAYEEIQQPPQQTQIAEGKIKASPAAKRVARENGVDLSKVTPTGPDGRIIEKDVLDFIETNKVKATPVAIKIAEEQGIDLATIHKAPGERITKQDLMPQEDKKEPPTPSTQKVIPVVGMRKIIAERMAKSKATVPHIYLTLEVDMTRAMELREKLLPAIQARYGCKLSYNDILIKASAVAIKQNPIINSSFIGDEIIIKEDINIGLAVALENGLIVPVVRCADKKGIGEISKDTAQLIEKARSGKLLPDDYQGGTFTITNLGMYDIENFKAIINQPESAILAVGKIMKKPIVIDDQIAIKPMMNLTLSCDHRVIDGAQGARFLQMLKQILEEPLEMLM